MNDDELVSVLEDAGLSPYQAEAYVALLELGNATATDVADSCDVPDPRIYDVLRDLESKGYVETYQQDSLTARAHDPETVLEDLRSRSSRYLEAAEDIEDRWNQPAVADHEVSIVKRFETVLSRAKALIDRAETQVQIGVDREQFEALAPSLEAAHERGVTVKVALCTDGEAELPTSSDYVGVCTEVRHRPIPTPFLVVVDRTWTCFAPHHRSVNEYGVLVSDRTYTYVFHWFFLTCLWEIWETVYTVRTEETPTRYVDIRHCARDLVALLDDGATVQARVEGYETGNDDPAVFEGRVVEVDYPGAAADDGEGVSLTQLAGRISVTLDVGDELIEVGGWGALLEEIEARTITLTDVSYE